MTKREQARSAGWTILPPSPVRFVETKQQSVIALEPPTGHSPLDCFKLLWSPNIHERRIKQTRAHVTQSYCAFSEDHLIATGWEYIGCHLDFIVEPCDTLKEHWQHKAYLPGRDAMLDLHAHRDSVDSYTLATLLSDNFCASVDVGSHVTIDELVAPSYIDSPAVSVIPRKPHSNGVLVWAAAVKLLGLTPYIIRFLPKTEEYPDWKTEDIVQNLVEPLDSSIKRKFTMDSWFDSQGVHEYLTSTGQYYTLGAHSGRDKAFWDQARHGLLPHTWKQFFNSNTNVMASVFSDKGVHCCMSSAYRPLTRLNQELPRCPLSEAYKKQFNVVDLFNRNFYKNLLPHKRMTVSKVLFDTCILITLLNARALYIIQDEADELSIKEFITEVRNSLLQV